MSQSPQVNMSKTIVLLAARRSALEHSEQPYPGLPHGSSCSLPSVRLVSEEDCSATLPQRRHAWQAINIRRTHIGGKPQEMVRTLLLRLGGKVQLADMLLSKVPSRSNDWKVVPEGIKRMN